MAGNYGFTNPKVEAQPRRYTFCRDLFLPASAGCRFFEGTSGTAAAAGQGTEQMVRRLVGVGDQQFKILAGRKPLATLPFADGGDGEARFDGDLLERNSFLAPPFPEGVGKAPAKITFESRFPKHGGISSQAATG